MPDGIYVRFTSNHFEQLRNAAPDEALRVLRAMGLEGVSIARQSMLDSPATGNEYRRGARVHTASSPGNAPRVDMGNLINTLRSEDNGADEVRIIAGSGEHAYAPYLEFGTTTMAPRPFMSPMALELERLTPRFFANFLEDELPR